MGIFIGSATYLLDIEVDLPIREFRFWVKFFPALFGALTILVVLKIIEELKGNLFALALGGTCVLFSAILSLNTLYQPNSFDVLSWTLLYYILIKYFHTENSKWLVVAAVVFAFGFLNKYNIVFQVLGLIPAILLSQQRRIFGKKQLYIAAFFGLLLISPNILWQYQNNFPVIHHLNELTATQLVNVDRFGFEISNSIFHRLPPNNPCRFIQSPSIPPF